MPLLVMLQKHNLETILRDVGGMLPKDYGADYTLEFLKLNQ
jgi:hypothetical protein